MRLAIKLDSFLKQNTKKKKNNSERTNNKYKNICVINLPFHNKYPSSNLYEIQTDMTMIFIRIHMYLLPTD